MAERKSDCGGLQEWELKSGDSIQKVAVDVYTFVIVVILLRYKLLLTINMILNLAIFT